MSNPQHKLLITVLEGQGDAIVLLSGLAPEGVVLGGAPPPLVHKLNLRKEALQN